MERGTCHVTRAMLGDVSHWPLKNSDRRSAMETVDHLGCRIVRSVLDERGRAWRVHEQRLAAAGRRLGSDSAQSRLIFTCDEAGIPRELRRTRAPLEALDDADLLQLLKCGC